MRLAAPAATIGTILMCAAGGPAVAAECPEKTANLLFHSCWGEATAELILLPEEADRATGAEPERRSIVVTGAYTGKDQRADGGHNPVGLFIDGGEVINPNLARMDGVVLIGPDANTLSIQRRSAVALGEAEYDLTEPDTRMAFAKHASERGVSVIQSHLLITSGELDVRQTEGAPVAIRRLLFTDDKGWGLWQSTGATTLYDTAVQFAAEQGAAMALNLDMGSYDYCIEYGGPVTLNCGVLGASDTGKLSNLLRFSYSPQP